MDSFGNSQVSLGWGDITIAQQVLHEVAADPDKERLRQFFLDRGDAPSAAANHANQVYDFHHADSDTLWITISDGFLWWCLAHPANPSLNPPAVSSPEACPTPADRHSCRTATPSAGVRQLLTQPDLQHCCKAGTH